MKNIFKEKKMKNLIYPRQNGKPLMALLMALFLFSCGSDEPDATDPDTPDLVCKAGSNDNCQEIFLTNAGIDCPDGLSSVSERCTGARLATCDNGAGIRWDYFGYDAFQLASEQQTCESMGHTWAPQSDPPVSFGVNVTTPDMSVTTEAGRSVTFDLVLTGQPTANVVITPTSSDTGEGTVSGALTFTTSTWNTPQQVTVTGVNDEIADGNQSYQITFRVSSTDTNYNNFSLDPVNVTNTDNNTPGITLIVADSTTSESANNNTGTIHLVLNTRPTDNVTITLASSDTGEGTVSPETLTFTTSTWDTEQQVIVTGVNDDIIDGDQSYQITFTVMSDDTNYNNFSLGPVGMTNVDNDRAGVTLTPSGSATTESGRSVTFTLVLTGQPTANATITPTSSDTGEGTVSEALTFTSDNWNTPQQVTVTGVNDEIADGNQSYQITFTVMSDDTNYNNFSLDPVNVTNTDNDTPGITLIVADSTTSESDNNNTGTIHLVLNTQPTADVTITPASSDTGEGTVSGALIFTTSTWDTEQQITVTGVNDDIDDGDQNYQITFTVMSDDTNYSNFSLNPVNITNTDNDTRGVMVSKTALSVMEGMTGTYTVKLNSQPTGNVTVRVAPDDDLVMVSIPSTSLTTAAVDLTFNSSNWDTPKTVIVAAGEDDDDAAVDDTVMLTNTASGGGYTTESATVTVTVTENDTATFMVTGPGTVSEDVGTVIYIVSLSARPAADVTVKYAIGGDATLDSGDYMFPIPGTSMTTGTLTFNMSDSGTNPWNTPQMIALTIVDDMIDENDETITFTLSEPTGGAALSAMRSVTTTIQDNDTRGVKVDTDPMMMGDQNTLTVPEGSLTGGTYTVVLNSEPTGDVTVRVGVSGSVGDVLVMAPMSSTSLTTALSLTFTTSNWNMPQTVRVTAADDPDAAIDASVTLTHTVRGADYGGRVTQPLVMVMITENDTRGVTVSKETLVVPEGGEADYTVVLDSQPTGDVAVTVGGASGDVSVKMPAPIQTQSLTIPSRLTFTTSNWDTPQTVTVAAAEDDDKTVDDAVTLTHTVSGADYGGGEVTASSVVVNIIENETATFSVTGPSSVKENVGMATYTVSLSADPTVSVRVDYILLPVSSTSMTTGTLEFTPDTTDSMGNWRTAQTVNVRIVDDRTDEAEAITFTLRNSRPSENAVLSTPASSVTTTIIDLPSSVEVSFGITTYTVPEGMMFGVIVTLNKDPRRTVTIPLTTMDGTGVTSGDYTFPTSVTFMSGETEKAVTFMATDDNDDENRERVDLGFGTPPSGVTVQMVSGSPSTASVEILDNE